MSDAIHFAVVITSTEWRSLLGLGELRLARRRVQEVHAPPTTKERDRLFGWGPTTVLGDGNDVVVLELSETWPQGARRHPAHPSELVVISHEDILTHHTVGPEFHDYLRGDAEREGIQLSTGRYEEPWVRWVDDQKASLGLAAANELLAVFGLDADLSRKRPDGYTWHDIMRLARNAKVTVKPRPKHAEDLLRSVRPISDAVAGVRGSAAFDLAVNIEWIQSRLKKDPFAKKATRALLEAALDAGQAVPWSRSGYECPPVSDALRQLFDVHSRAYTAEITPETVPTIVRLVMSAKDQTLDPIDVPAAVAAFTSAGNPDAARMLCVALSGALGPLVSKRLTRVLTAVNLVPLDWS